MHGLKRGVRACLSGLFFLSYGLFALPFALLLPFCFSRRAGRWIVRTFYCLFVFFARVTGLFRVTYEPRFPFDRSHASVIVMNHLSLIDICVLLAHIPDAVCFAKAATKKNPFLAAVVKRLFIANDKGGEEMLAEAASYLARGVHVVIFPQGTRGGETFHRGAARLALAARTDILVYHISYDPLVLAKGQPWWDVGARTIRIALRAKGRLLATGPNTHHEAVALTQQIRSALF